MPIRFDLLRLRLDAIEFGKYPSRSASARTLFLVFLLIDSLFCKALDTVESDRFNSLARSFSVTFGLAIISLHKRLNKSILFEVQI